MTAEGEIAVTQTHRRTPEIDIDVFGDEFLANPHSFHGRLRDAGPLIYLSRYDVFGMARHAEVSAALKDWSAFLSSRGVGLSDFSKEEPWRPPSLLLETDPPVHDRTRGLMNAVVNLATLRTLRPLWQSEADRLVADLIDRRNIDGIQDLAQIYPLRIFPSTIGLPDGGEDHLLAYAMATFNAFGPRNHIFDAANTAAGPSVAWIAMACERANLKPGGWGRAVYAAADAGVCTDDEAARLVRSFLSAGVDTTINGIGNMLLAFAENPDQWAKLRDTPSLVKRVFDEALRWDSTVQTFFRTTSRPIEIADSHVPEGAKVLLFLAAANRDPRKWQNPEKFDLDRVTSGHVGFGYGIHQCLGQMVARMEAETILAALIPKVKEIRMTGAPVRILNNTLHALGSLPIELVRA
jgi:cytochrome P450